MTISSIQYQQLCHKSERKQSNYHAKNCQINTVIWNQFVA